MKIIFVSGTGTEVGKTYVAEKLAQQARRQGVGVGVYKPVASGCIPGDRSPDREMGSRPGDLVSEDAVRLWLAAGKPLDLDAVCPQRFAAPLAPNEAARLEGKAVDVDALAGGISRWRGRCDLLIIEGAGGLFSPLADGMLNVDLLLQIPAAELVLVAPNRLGVIHDVIATFRAAKASKVDVERVVLTQIGPVADPSREGNAGQIRENCPGVQVQEVGWDE